MAHEREICMYMVLKSAFIGMLLKLFICKFRPKFWKVSFLLVTFGVQDFYIAIIFRIFIMKMVNRTMIFLNKHTKMNMS